MRTRLTVNKLLPALIQVFKIDQNPSVCAEKLGIDKTKLISWVDDRIKYGQYNPTILENLKVIRKVWEVKYPDLVIKEDIEILKLESFLEQE
ncbi:MAG: hypothetical protein QW303_03245 [Nitrososphaerota archaeon]